MEMAVYERPIIALDFPTWTETEQFLRLFEGEPLFVKVGMELYLQNGPSIIYSLKERNHRIFLDLKLHDIPNTVEQAMKGLSKLGVDMINVHALGGKTMMERAREGLEAGGCSRDDRPRLLAVTQLTSTSEKQVHDEMKVSISLKNHVLHLASLAKEAGVDGVVCSPHEAGDIKQHCGKEFLRVTPGIRLAGDNPHDQHRIATPMKARQLGSSMIVVGRSITKAEDPLAAYHQVKREWEGMKL
jgi:orotidine-5'-phosphate decarboxylase